MQTFLEVLTVIAGLSGWAAVGAWWLREKTKSVRALKELRHRNNRLQKSVIFTLTKWREHVEQSRIFYAVEHEYAERLARDAGVSSRNVKSTVRAAVEDQVCSGVRINLSNAASIDRQLESINQVEQFVESGKGTIAELEINDEIRKVA